MTEEQRDNYNQSAMNILQAIGETVRVNGGCGDDFIYIIERIVVLAFGVGSTGSIDAENVDIFCEHVKDSLQKMRLATVAPGGVA